MPVKVEYNLDYLLLKVYLFTAKKVFLNENFN